MQNAVLCIAPHALWNLGKTRVLLFRAFYSASHMRNSFVGKLNKLHFYEIPSWKLIDSRELHSQFYA